MYEAQAKGLKLEYSITVLLIEEGSKGIKQQGKEQF
jgi:hypothetical protein